MTTKRKATTSKANKAKAAEAKSKAGQIQVYKELAPVAKEINHRLAQAEKLTEQAFDHRLAAALQLGAAKKRCEKDKINFKEWTEANVDKSYETVRKLASIGVHPENKARLMLQDLRERTRSAVAKSRATKPTSSAAREPVKHATPVNLFTQALTIAKNLGEKEQLELAREIAGLVGHSIIPKTEFLRWRARAESVADGKPVTIDKTGDLMDIPAQFKRSTGKLDIAKPAPVVKAKATHKNKRRKAA